MHGRVMTADELLYVSYPNKRTELVEGRVIVREPAGGRHGAVAARAAFLLMSYVEEKQLGRVYAAETGFLIATNPDTVRAPDVAFVARERVLERDPTGFPRLAPDLVVEVLSPDDRTKEVLGKVREWLSAGTRLVWVIDPELDMARAYRSDGTVTDVAATGRLSGEKVLPGFAVSLSSLLRT
jgi:Uma2 family endonuclease